MNTPVTHRLVAMALSVVLTLGLFQGIGLHAGPEQAPQTWVRVPAEVAGRT